MPNEYFNDFWPQILEVRKQEVKFKRILIGLGILEILLWMTLGAWALRLVT